MGVDRAQDIREAVAKAARVAVPGSALAVLLGKVAMRGVALGVRGLGVGMGGASYTDKVLSYNPIIYFPLNETAGLTAINYGTLGTAANGTYTGVTLNDTLGPDGVNGAPLFDGVNDLVDIYSAAFDGAFDGDEGTALMWAKVYNAGVWTDNAYHFMLSLGEDANNRIHLLKSSNVDSNQLRSLRRAAGATLANVTAVTPTDWFCQAITWSKAADEIISYYAGSPYDSTLNGLAAWVGALTNTFAYIGAYSGGGYRWYGWLSHLSVYTSALSPAAIADLSTI